jgi:hypothetical protein
MYVTELVVSDTVNTMPEATIKAMADHGELQGETVHGTCDAARQVFADLERLGISYHDVMRVIEDEGVAKFGASWSELLNTIRKDMGSSAGPSLDEGSPVVISQNQAHPQTPRHARPLRPGRSATRRSGDDYTAERVCGSYL